MSNSPNRRKTAKQAMRERPAGELAFTVRIAPPDGDRDADDQPVHADIEVDLRHFTLSERQLVKRAMAKMATPTDWDDVVVVHAWVVWRRTHPESSLQTWMDDIEWGELLDALKLEPGHVEWDTTPEGFDPEA